MKIAVTYDNGMIFQHFGHTEQFKVYEVSDNQITHSEVIGNNGAGHEALAALLSDGDVEILICGGIGGGAQMALAEYGIRVVPGVHGSADEAVKMLLEGKLEFSYESNCHHHDEEHSCGGHDDGCGHGGCH